MEHASLSPNEEMYVESHAPYLKVFFALAVLTAVEYFYARIFKDSFSKLVLGLMILAVVKAGMVGWYFMHLKFEGKWVYAMLVPAAILAVIFTLVLLPDIMLAPILEQQTAEDDRIDSAFRLPVRDPNDPPLVISRLSS